MIEDIKVLKAKVLQFMDQEVGKYGGGRMDVKQVGELADVIKDLAEAEYYCTVAEAMGGAQEPMGYGQPMGSGGTSGGSRRGYGGTGSMGHNDPMEMMRNMLAGVSPEMRKQLLSEFM